MNVGKAVVKGVLFYTFIPLFVDSMAVFPCRVPSKIEWDLTNGPPSIRYTGLGVRSVGPVGDFLEELLGLGPPNYFTIYNLCIHIYTHTYWKTRDYFTSPHFQDQI